MNRLVNERSAYLKHAAHQKIDWYPWSEEAFDRARKEDKAVFLSSGAMWCHWCHVMAQETFEDEDTMLLMNKLFINIKLDRDERPEIDRRYQQAVAALGGGSGWPLSVFLTPDKRVFYGGTYFPPEDRQGRPGFKRILISVADYYKTKRGDVLVYAQRAMDVLIPEPLPAEELSESMVREAEDAIVDVVDFQNGGFGGAPKFPMPGVLEFLIRRSLVSKNPLVGKAGRRMLEAMSAGGFHDQLGGGFHRYSVDEAWIMPHFEKMADDNAGLLKNYVDGYSVFGDELFRTVARGIIGFTHNVLADPEGGFYASQDADVTPDDEGGYFTWTEEDFKKALDTDEYDVLSSYYLHDRGKMHHDPMKRVLYIAKSLEEINLRLKRDPGEVKSILKRGKSKLLSERMLRETPFIDRVFYPSLNGMLISSYFHTFMVLNDEWVKSFGIKSLDRVLRDCVVEGVLVHAKNIRATLDDYVNLIDALISGYEATAVDQYLWQAEDYMSLCIENFFDRQEGGFFDTEQDVLGARLKRIEDVPHPSANALAIMLLLKLALITGKNKYRKAAEQSLKIFSALAREIKVHAGAYLCCVDASFHMLKMTIEAHPGSELACAARALAGKQYIAIVYGEDRGQVVPCIRDTCLEPIRNPGIMRGFHAELPRL
jgi:uncharacterized protein YyaL (SSP411 family)